MNDCVNASPLIGIFGMSSDDAKALKNVYDIVNASSFNAELASALIEQEAVLLLLAVDAEKASA